MKGMPRYTWFRFLASALIAGVLIIAVVGAAIRHFERPEPDPLLAELQYVDVVNLAENPALAEAVRKEREKHGDLPPPGAPPPPDLPPRQVSGFVHVEYVINPDGTVTDVRVVGAAPAGVYERQAVEQVRRSMHAPAYSEDGEALPRRATEIVEFTVPASTLREPGLESR